MKNVNLTKKELNRGIDRMKDIRNSSTNTAVNAVYDSEVAPAVAAYEAAQLAEEASKETLNAKRREMGVAIEAADQPFRFARAVLSIRAPDIELPGTLKGETTPTEMKMALEKVQSVVTSHHGEDWADLLAAGPFGTTAADAIAKIVAFDTATDAFIEARTARRRAATVVYPMVLAFKEVLKNGGGAPASSYVRLRTRARKAAPPPTTTPTSPTPPAPTPETTPASPPPPADHPTNGASSAPVPPVPSTTA